MNCKQIQKKLSQWLSGDLSVDAAKTIESHLVDCPECTAELRFQQRLNDQLGGAAMPDPTMRYRLETELDDVDAGWNATYEKWASFGANLMKKAVWPVTAALVAVGTYTIMFPQGALAVAWRESMSAAQDGADDARSSDKKSSERTSDEDVFVTVMGDGEESTSVQVTSDGGEVSFVELRKSLDLTDAEAALMSTVKVHSNVSRNGDDVKHDWKVEFDKAKYQSVKGEKPGIEYIVPKGDKSIRGVVTFDPKTNELRSVNFQRQVDGKWETYGSKFHNKFQFFSGEGFDFELDPEQRKELELKLKDLRDMEVDFLIDKEQLEKMKLEMEKHFNDGEFKIDGDRIMRLKLDDMMSPEEKAKFEADMKRLREEMKDLKLEGGRKMTDKERAEFEKAMRELEKEMSGMKFEFDFSDLDHAMKLDIEGLKNLEKLEGLKNLELRGLHDMKLSSLDGIAVMRSFTVKNGNEVETWDVKYNEERFDKKAGPADNVTYLVDKKDADKRYVVTRERKDGKVIRVEKQAKKDGKWINEKTMDMDHFGRTKRKNDPPVASTTSV